jgi:hypothetical protein
LGGIFGFIRAAAQRNSIAAIRFQPNLWVARLARLQPIALPSSSGPLLSLHFIARLEVGHGDRQRAN